MFTTALKILCALLGLGLLAGCEQGNRSQELQDYLQRLARPLDTPAPLLHSLSYSLPPRPPAVASLRRELPSGNLGTLDFLALSGCEVQITIGKRNSSLGRLASASQRLILDLEYLQLAPACIRHLQQQGKDELATLLSDNHRLKQQQLPLRLFEATLGGPEYRALWRAPRHLKNYPEQTSSAVITALESIAQSSERWLSGDYRADSLSFELSLSEVAKGDGGHLLMALALQQAALGAANQLLQTRMAREPLCRPRWRPPAADIIPTVVRQRFTSVIQPWSAALARRHYQLLPPIHSLEQQLEEALHPDYRHWRNSRDKLLNEWNQAPKQHVQTLQTLLEPCGGFAGL